jgi:hypothetical protein
VDHQWFSRFFINAGFSGCLRLEKQVCAADRADVQNGIGIPMINRALFVPPSKRSLRDI